MDGEIVTADAQGPVVAWCVVMDMLIITMCNMDRSHRNPAQQEHIEPDVKEEDHVIVRVASTNTIVQPNTVCFVAICALVTSVTVLCARWLNHFALGTQLAPW